MLIIPKQASKIVPKIPSFLTAGLLLTASLSGCKNNQEHFEEHLKNNVKHVVVIYMENHSFDNLFGQFEGANGSNGTDSIIIQVRADNTPYTYLPAPAEGYSFGTFPMTLSNKSFNIDQYVPSFMETPDALHNFYEEQLQINGGKMNKFAAYNSYSAGLAMGYYNTKALPLYPIAKEYTLCDNFFHSAFGGSFLNHHWLIAAATPEFKDLQDTTMYPVPDELGRPTKGKVTRDGYVINTSYSVNRPRPDSSVYISALQLIPNQTNVTIGDRLTEKGVSWAWYSGGWDNAMRGMPDKTFQYHHQPFIYYANYSDTAKTGRAHLKDENEFLRAAQEGKLPEVSFVKPLGLDNEHPGYSEVFNGEHHAVELINAVLNGPNGKDAVIILTYDENGGFWDHVAPPNLNSRWGPGTRVPAIIISPFAKKGAVDHTQYETLSILAFIEKRWNLKPLNARDSAANPFRNAFNF